MNAKIEELRFRIKTDPKSRLFYPLAEELRKVSEYGEAESVLRTGITHHPTYLSAWVSLGRVLHEQEKNKEAVEVLTRALQLDQGNVVAARLLADAYIGLGEKVEAIKKYKLVYALMPSDDELETIIQSLEEEIRQASAPPPVLVAAPPPEPAVVEPAQPPALAIASPEAPIQPVFDPFAAAPEDVSERLFQPTIETPFPEAMPSVPQAPSAGDELTAPMESPFASHNAWQDDTSSMRKRPATREQAGDEIPMAASHAESPFEQSAAGADYGMDAFAVEQPEGMHVEPAPAEAELPVVEVAIDAAPISAAGIEPSSADDPWATPSEEPVEEPAASLAPIPLADVSAIDEPVLELSPYANTFDVPPRASEAPATHLKASAASEEGDDLTNTLTMADLYEHQGLLSDARRIYEALLSRNPGAEGVRERLRRLDQLDRQAGSLEPDADEPVLEVAEPASVKIARLQSWLSSVSGKREVRDV